MSGIGLQLATDEELLRFQHHSQPKHENTFVICKVESGSNTTSQQLTLLNYQNTHFCQKLVQMRNNIIIVQQCKLQYVKFHVVAIIVLLFLYIKVA